MPNLTTRAAKGSEQSHDEMDANFTRTVSQKTTTYSVLSSDNRSLIEGNHATTPFTITLGDAATMLLEDTGDFEVALVNTGVAAVTVAPAGTDTINGSTSSIVMLTGAAAVFKIDSTGTNYQLTGTKHLAGQASIISGLGATSGTITVNLGQDSFHIYKIGRLLHVQGTLSVMSVSSPIGLLTWSVVPKAAPSSLSELADLMFVPVILEATSSGGSRDGIQVLSIAGGSQIHTITAPKDGDAIPASRITVLTEVSVNIVYMVD